MNVIKARPPMFDEIDAAFKVAGKPILFCWGDTIYNPEGASISYALLQHETVHSARQGLYPDLWWRHYISMPEFRLQEELPAHIEEYRAFCTDPRARRQDRRVYLTSVAKRLSSSLYGGLISFAAAKSAIRAGAAA